MDENNRNRNNRKTESLENQAEPGYDPICHFDVNDLIEELKKEHPQWAEILKKRSEGFEYEEIARELNIPLGTVKSTMNRIRKFAILRLLRQKNPQWAQILELHYQGKQSEEISSLLNIPICELENIMESIKKFIRKLYNK